MNAKLATMFTVAAAIASASQARAQTAPKAEGFSFGQHLDAPSRALELTFATGYTQGFGNLMKDVPMGSVITPGFALDFGVAYRINPRWSIGGIGQYQEFNAERATSGRGLLTGAAATYHFMPYQRTDPWLQFGSGYRLLWENSNSTTLTTHGFELARVNVGVDIRVDQDIAIAPVVGGGLTLPLWQDGGTQTAIADPRVSTFFFAGLQGRFDVTDRHESGRKAVGQTQITQATLPKPAEAAPQPKPSDEVRLVSPSIAVEDELLALCNLHLDNIDKAPKFEFDKADLLPADLEVLQKIAECFTTGPLKGASMELTGRADPRGTEKYNDALGMRRATRVSSALQFYGVEQSHIGTISRGERDAVGTDEYTWAIDRRVDIRLAK